MAGPDELDPTRTEIVPPHDPLETAVPEGAETPAVDLAAQLTAPADPSLPLGPPGFELLRELGGGGNGIVYLARQNGLNRLVAIKLMKSSSANAIRRFLVESEMVASVRHHNVVEVYQFGEHEKLPFLVLEYCPGGDLTGQIPVGGMPADQAAEVIAGVAGGAGAAHAAGIVHRDLKPHNVLLDEAGTVKVSDFGLAKQGLGSQLTPSEAVLGTAAYMSPEQAGGGTKFVGPEADVWSLGVMFYELLTGKRPFLGPSTYDHITQILAGRYPTVRSLRADVPRDLERVVEKCLSPEPRDRYKSGAELAADLQRFQNGEPLSIRPVRFPERAWKWSRRHQALAALYTVSAVAVLLLLALGFWFSNRLGAADGAALAARGETVAAESRAALAQTEEQKAKDMATAEGYFRLMTDLRARERVRKPGWSRSGTQGIRQRIADGLPAEARLSELRTEAIGCLSGWDVGPRRELVAGDIAAIAVHPRGDWLAVGHRRATAFLFCRVVLVDPRSGKELRSLAFTPSQMFQIRKGGQDGPRHLAVSPDGRWLVAGARSGELHLWDLSAPKPVAVSWTGHEQAVTALTFAADGSCFYSGSLDKTVKRWTLGATKPAASWTAPNAIHTVVPLAGGWEIACGWNGPNSGVELLQSDTLGGVGERWEAPGSAFAPLPHCGLCIVSDGGSVQLCDPRRHDDRNPLRRFLAPGQESAHTDLVRQIAARPDGRVVATSGADHHVRLWDAVGSRLALDIPLPLGDNGAMQWDPSGKALFVSTADRVVAFDVVAPTVQVALSGDGLGRGVAWSPDGRTLAATTGHNIHFDDVRIWDTDAFGLPNSWFRSRTTLPFDDRFSLRRSPNELSFSPEGQRIAVRADKRIAVLDAATGHPIEKLSVRGVTAVQWKPNRLWASLETEVRSWAMPGGKPLASWSNGLRDRISGKGTVNAVAVGQQGVVVACRDGGVWVLRPDDAKVVRNWSGVPMFQLQTPLIRQYGSSAETAAVSPNEQLAAVGKESGELAVLRLPDGEWVARRPGAHEETITAVAFVSDSLLISGSEDATIRLWSLANGQLTEILALRTTGAVVGLAVTGDGTRLAVAIRGELGVRVWRLDHLWSELSKLGLDPGFPQPTAANPRPASPPQGLQTTRKRLSDGWGPWAGINAPSRTGWIATATPAEPIDSDTRVRQDGWLKAPKAGKYLLAIVAAKSARVWLDGALVLDATKPGVRSVSVTLTGKPQALRMEYLECDSVPGAVLQWEPLPAKGSTCSQPIPATHLFLDHATAAATNVPPLPRMPVGDTVRSFPGHLRSVHALAVSPDGSRLAVAGDDSLWLWDLTDSGPPLALRKGELAHAARPVSGLSFSPDGTRLATVADDRSARVWDVPLLQPRKTFERHTFPLVAVAWTNDGQLQAGGIDGKDSRFRVAESEGDRMVKKSDHVVPGEGKVTGGWSPFGEPPSILPTDSVLRVVGREDVPARIRTNPWHLHRAEWLPDRRQVLAATNGGRANPGGFATVWDATDKVGRCRWVDQNTCTGVWPSPDGKWFATTGTGPIRLWDALTGEEVARFGQAGDRSNVACFTPDGKHLIAGGNGRLATVRMWRIPPAK